MDSSVASDNTRGFGLVEVVIAMLILALIAVALVPPLWQGLQCSAQQSTVATATRELNKLVNRPALTRRAMRPRAARHPSESAALPATFTDGRGATITVTAQGGYTCTSKALVRIDLTARDTSNRIVAKTTAEVFTDGT